MSLHRRFGTFQHKRLDLGQDLTGVGLVQYINLQGGWLQIQSIAHIN